MMVKNYIAIYALKKLVVCFLYSSPNKEDGFFRKVRSSFECQDLCIKGESKKREWYFLIHQAPANRWSLVSHMVSVRTSTRKQNSVRRLRSLQNKTKTRDHATWGAPGGSLNLQDFFVPMSGKRNISLIRPDRALNFPDVAWNKIDSILQTHKL